MFLNGWKFFKSTPSMLAFQPLGKGMSGKLLEICCACAKAREPGAIRPVTKSTPVGLKLRGYILKCQSIDNSKL